MNTGLDPEVLVVREDGGMIVPASNFLPPPTEDESGKLNQLSYDNAAVEMRPDCTEDPKVLVDRLRVLLTDASTRMFYAKMNDRIPKDSRITLWPSAALVDADRDLESVQEFGCSPSQVLSEDYDTVDVKPLCTADQTPMRSAGFHIHQELSHGGTSQAVVAVLDGILGLTDVLMNAWLDHNNWSKVRRLGIGYGRAGEYRTRWIGEQVVLEYRTLSPWPLLHPKLTEWVINITRLVGSMEYDDLVTLIDHFPPRGKIVSAINDHEVQDANRLRFKCISKLGQFAGALSVSNNQLHSFNPGRSRKFSLQYWSSYSTRL